MKPYDRPVFRKVKSDQLQFQELSGLVYKRLGELPGSRMTIVHLKMVLLPATYLLFYLLALHFAHQPPLFVLFYILMGLTSVSLFLNLIHEACHGNLFKNPRWNQWYYHVFDLLGINSYIWKVRHLELHHNYSNIAGWDSDIEQSGPMKIYPHPAKENRVHSVQHIIFPLIYLLYLPNWVFARDFQDYFNRSKIVRKAIPEIPAIEYVKLFLFKIFFFFYIIAIPLHHFNAGGATVLMALMAMLFSSSAFALFALLTPHVNVSNQFPLPDAKHRMGVSWFLHQFLTTNDVRAENFFTRHVMGNSNYHLVHHLFPTISSAYAPEITHVIETYAEAHQLPYRAFSFREAFRMHYQLISANARNARLITLEN